MEQKSLAYAKYWRICLADADLGKGTLDRSELDNLILRPGIELKNGRVDAELVQEFFKESGQEVKEVEVTIRPYIYHSRLEHGKKKAGGVPQVVTPIVSQALIDRQGRLYPNKNTVIPRDILEPLDKGSFAVGDVEELDTWLADHDVPTFDKQSIGERDTDEWHYERWQAYLKYIKDMLNAVAPSWQEADATFQMDDRWCIVKDSDVVGACMHIVSLYDNIILQAPASLLFDQYASENVKPPETCQSSNSGFSLRLGHASDTHPLADAQRDSLTHQLASKHGEILGVNGPPGTGKTTMLLSVVASHWVRAALNGEDPPVIAAASTNNQAVTNVIDAFAKDFSIGTGPFAGRWLPDIKSFGAYFPSSTKETNSDGKYQTRSFFSKVEEQGYYSRAKEYFMKAASVAFPDLVKPSLNDICSQLHRLIKNIESNLRSIETAWPLLLSATDSMHRELGSSPVETLELRERAASAKASELSTCKALMDKWEEFHGNESWIFTLFSWLPPVNKKRLLRAKTFLKGIWSGTFPEKSWKNIEQFTDEIQTLVYRVNGELSSLQAKLQQGMNVMKSYREALSRWGDATDCLRMPQPPELRTLAECDKAADTVIRFTAFLYATHYWEARWLLEMEGMLDALVEEKNKKGALTLKKRWRRRMMLTPCVVSTFFMLPKEFVVSRYERGSFVPDYLYDFIDLLIVDEAGQVLPEVAGASFSLAKRALVIGDTLQIEPIWSITTQVDIGNLIKAKVMGLTDVRENYNRIAELGKSAASGSVMEIAQGATRYHYDNDLARGMYLYEHRRCYDEIVEYCNALCYHNKLIPKRGARGSASGLPAMGYLNIDGKCERRGGSRVNKIEAVTIAEWIVRNRLELEERYKKPIYEIIGVVTPFGGQVNEISKQCARLGLKVGKDNGDMTVGTVHSLQGAERLVVIFSPTYSKGADGGFIDRSPSMLNVGVSRAKDSFLVFGDMSIFNPINSGSPRGLLASFLFGKDGNAITIN